MLGIVLGLGILALGLFNLGIWIIQGNVGRALISVGLVAMTHYSLILRWRSYSQPKKP